MKIERINENQIRCTLSNFDLTVRNLNLSELAYGSEKARNLFREMIQRASNEVGFDAEDIPLMVEAIPMANESVMLIITKVEDPEELDTRFSKFSPSDEDEENSWTALASELLEGADGILNLMADLDKKGKGKQTSEQKPEQEADESKNTARQIRIFTFASLDAVCAAARETGPIFTGLSILYKNPAAGKYFLVLTRENCEELAFSRTCNTLAEYGSRVRAEAASAAYCAEHYEVIVKQNALQALSAL